MEDLFRAIDGHQNGEANPQNDKSSDNPFDQQFKKSITPSAKRTSAVEPNAEKDVVEIQQNEEHVDESVQNTVPNVGREVTVDAEQQTPVQQEPQQSERKSQEPQFKVSHVNIIDGEGSLVIVKQTLFIFYFDSGRQTYLYQKKGR